MCSYQYTVAELVFNCSYIFFPGKMVYLGTGLGVAVLALATVLLLFFRLRKRDVSTSKGAKHTHWNTLLRLCQTHRTKRNLPITNLLVHLNTRWSQVKLTIFNKFSLKFTFFNIFFGYKKRRDVLSCRHYLVPSFEVGPFEIFPNSFLQSWRLITIRSGSRFQAEFLRLTSLRM